MGWSVVASLALALIAIVAAFGVVMAGRPTVRRLRATNRPPPEWLLSAQRAAPDWLRNRAVQSGVVLAAGAITAIALLFVFVEILDSVRDNDDLTAFDRPVIEWVAAHRTDWLNHVVIALTDIGGKAGLTVILTVTAAGIAYRLRSWRPVILAVVAGGGGALLVTGVKTLVARDRPDPLLRAVTEDGFSFPSGHSASSLVVLCTVAWLFGRVAPNRTAQATAWVAAVLLAVSIGLSRIYLGVHYPTDVLAGWVLGTTWLITVAVATWIPGSPILPLLRRRHARREPAAADH